MSKACGSKAAYERHKKRGEPIDYACQAAHKEYMRGYRASEAAGAVSQRRRQAAKSRAMHRLTSEYPARFAALLADELT